MTSRLEEKKLCWLSFWALILRWVTLKTYGHPLIIKRDGLLVSACETLASCPAGFTRRHKCFTSKTHKIQRWHAPADLERGSGTHTKPTFTSSLSLLMELSCFGHSPFHLDDFLDTVSPPSKSSMGFLHFCSLWKANSADGSADPKGEMGSSFSVWHFFGSLLMWITSVLYFSCIAAITLSPHVPFIP